MAAKIPEEKVSELRQSVDIVDIISEYVQLKKHGRNYFGLCPFHHENTPSFSVSPEKQIFHCFGCGTGGNVITFIMEAEGASFQEAAAIIAEKGNVPLDIRRYGPADRRHIPPHKQRMLSAHELLGKFYHHLLMNTNEGSDALDYLTSRGMSAESLRKFQIGYALPSWDIAVKYLKKHGFSPEEMEKAGLIIKKENGEGYFDRFRNRIMFPLLDTQGNIVAFSARALADDDHPKYLNTPETVLFDKSSLLYNYYGARSEIRRHGFAVLFEGFADVISADDAGVQNGVAVMGTSLTEKHVHLLKRLTDTVILCMDSDPAGVEAAYRAGLLLTKRGLETKVALLPQGYDPDDYIQEKGAERFRREAIGNAQTWTAFKLRYFRMGKNLQNEGEKLEYIEKVIKELSLLDSPLERDLYTRQLAEEFSLSLEILQEQISNLAETNKKRQTPARYKPQPYAYKRENRLPKGPALAERILIARMMRDQKTAYKVMELLGGQSFHYEEHQAIITYLLGYFEDGHHPDPALFLQCLPDRRLRSIVTEIEMMAIDGEYTEEELKDCVKHVLKHGKMLMIKEKLSEQRAAEQNRDMEKAQLIAREIIELRKSL
jgi:DNA primase